MVGNRASAFIRRCTAMAGSCVTARLRRQTSGRLWHAVGIGDQHVTAVSVTTPPILTHFRFDGRLVLHGAVSVNQQNSRTAIWKACSACRADSGHDLGRQENHRLASESSALARCRRSSDCLSTPTEPSEFGIVAIIGLNWR